MRSRLLRTVGLIALSLLMLLAIGCQSELDDKTAAEVSAVPADAGPEEAEEPAAEEASIAVIGDQSEITWYGEKITRGHDGGFNEFEGRVFYEGESPSRLDFTIDLESVWSDTDQLTGHLKSDDFFDVANFPEARFSSTNIESLETPTEKGENFRITGVLAMHGVERQVSFPATIEQNAEGIRALAEFKINRQDWDISYPGAPDDLIRDEVLINLNLLFPPPPGVAAAG